METVGEARPSSSGMLKPALIILGVLVGCALAYLIVQFFLIASIAKDIPPGFRVAFAVSGPYEYFEFTGDSLVPSSGAQGPDGTVITESVDLQDGTRAVIAALPGTARMIVGLITETGAFKPLHEEETMIMNLSVWNGMAVFSILPSPPATVAAQTGETAPEGAENDVIEEGSAEGPPSEFPAFVPGPQPQIAVISLENGPALRTLGSGTSPRFHPDGSIIAVTAAGIAKISPADGRRTLVLEIPPEDSVISPDGSLVALRTSSSTFDLYDISVRVEHLGTAAQTSAVHEAAFLDNERLVLRTADRASLYLIDDAQPVRLLAIMPIAR